MADGGWQTKRLSITSLHLDSRNPRLGPGASEKSPRDLIQELFAHDKALEIAQSIARRGYFANEPLLAVREANRYVVVEGNRRLAALKALKEPPLLDGSMATQVSRLSKQIQDPTELFVVPVVVAPSRRATDRQLAGRHVGTPVLPWAAESRANFILEKLDEGYSVEELSTELGFSAADVESARRTRAIVEATRSLALPPDISSKVDSRRSSVFTTIERIFDSTVGRRYLKVEPDSEHGFRGLTSPDEFVRALTKLVTDVATGEQSSRTLNTGEDIERYFESWQGADIPKTTGSFLPDDLVASGPRSFEPEPAPSPAAPRGKRQPALTTTIVPREFKVLIKNDRLIEIRNELTKLKRGDFPNAGAVLLRVFFELSVLDYLRRTGEFQPIVDRLKSKNALQGGSPTIAQLAPDIVRIAKVHFSTNEAAEIEKAVTPNKAAPFTVSDLNAFVHNPTSFPGERDIVQFWTRIEPLMRLMLGHQISGHQP